MDRWRPRAAADLEPAGAVRGQARPERTRARLPALGPARRKRQPEPDRRHRDRRRDGRQRGRLDRKKRLEGRLRGRHGWRLRCVADHADGHRPQLPVRPDDRWDSRFRQHLLLGQRHAAADRAERARTNSAESEPGRPYLDSVDGQRRRGRVHRLPERREGRDGHHAGLHGQRCRGVDHLHLYGRRVRRGWQPFRTERGFVGDHTRRGHPTSDHACGLVGRRSQCDHRQPGLDSVHRRRGSRRVHDLPQRPPRGHV